MVQPKTHQQLKSNKNVTVNPWSAVKVNLIASGNMPPINSSCQSVINETFTREDITTPANFDTEDVCDNEPIYNEIKHEPTGFDMI